MVVENFDGLLPKTFWQKTSADWLLYTAYAARIMLMDNTLADWS